MLRNNAILDTMVGFFFGFFIGTLSISLAWVVVSNHNPVIAACEAKLPRDQVCEYIAVPIVKEDTTSEIQ